MKCSGHRSECLHLVHEVFRQVLCAKTHRSDGGLASMDWWRSGRFSGHAISAFEAFCVREPDYSRGFQDLFVIVHRCKYQIAPAWSLPSRRCLALSCRGCEQGSGGYQFRWWHRSWESDYEKLCRPGAWKRNELQATQESSVGTASVSPDLAMWLPMLRAMHRCVSLLTATIAHATAVTEKRRVCLKRRGKWP